MFKNKLKIKKHGFAFVNFTRVELEKIAAKPSGKSGKLLYPA